MLKEKTTTLKKIPLFQWKLLTSVMFLCVMVFFVACNDKEDQSKKGKSLTQNLSESKTEIQTPILKKVALKNTSNSFSNGDPLKGELALTQKNVKDLQMHKTKLEQKLLDEDTSDDEAVKKRLVAYDKQFVTMEKEIKELKLKISNSPKNNKSTNKTN